MHGFYRLSLTTLLAVFILILAGGVVRSTGSGMGCPDWPKCFGQWVPPTKAEQLPENYKEVYSQIRHQKNIRFASYLSTLGFDETALHILNDKSILEEADFNATKTWTEYINRLIGVIVGFLILLMAFLSLKFWDTHRKITVLCFTSLIAVLFQGWIGSIVVSTNLLPWTITLHMVLALVIVLLLVCIYHLAASRSSVINSAGKILRQLSIILPLSMVLLVIQIVLGTQVREKLDLAAASLGQAQRGSWIEQLGEVFLIHRSFSWFILIINGLLVWKLFQLGEQKGLTIALIIIILTAFLSGVGMSYFGVPAFLQPLHLLFATLAFGFLALLWFRLFVPVKNDAQLV